MKSTFTIICLLCLISGAAAQTGGKVNGRIFSDSLPAGIEGASVALQNAVDSSVEKITLSGKGGSFAFSDIRYGDYRLHITVLNHIPFTTPLQLSDKRRNQTYDSIFLRFAADSLTQVTVKAIRSPVKIFGDTTEYNAGSFKTKENAMTEELLRKLPGLEVLRDGTIKAHGEKVTQILVDGQPFFGGDPTVATQNLPTNIISKIQVIEEKTENAKTTKIEDGIRNKVINIIIKEDKKKGSFGRVYIGKGTSGTYEGRLSANRFVGPRKFALVASTNNTGRNDFGGDNDAGGRTFYNNYNGISKDVQVRLNYNDKLGKHTNISGNLGYNDNMNTSGQVRNRQNIFGDSSTFYREGSNNQRGRSGLSLGFNFDHRPDTLFDVRANGNLAMGRSTSASSSAFNSTQADTKKINDGERSNRSISFTPSINGNISGSRRFKHSKGGIHFNLNSNTNQSNFDNYNISSNNFYPVNLPEYQRIINQFSDNNSKSSSANASVGFNKPVGKKGNISVNLSQSRSVNNNQRELFDYNLQSGLYDRLNDTLSSHFKTVNSNTSIGFNYSYNLKKGSVALGSSWQNARSNSRSLTSDSSYRQQSRSLVPYISFNTYRQGKSINLHYTFNTIAPQASQLQPVLDNSNPLYLRLGNPNLRYSSTHRLNGSINFYNQKNNTSINVNGNLSAVSNSFATSTIFDKVTGVQITQPINVNGVYSGGVNVSYNKPFKLAKQNLRWNANSNINFNRNVSLLDNERNTSLSMYLVVSSGIDFEIEEWLQLGLNYNLSRQATNYSLRPAMNNSSYTNAGNLRAEITPFDLTELRVDWNFSSNTGRSAGFNRKINLVNADLTQYFDKRKQFWLMLKGYDLLRQNVGIMRSMGVNYIEDTEMSIISRFFLVSANWRLSKFGGKKRS